MPQTKRDDAGGEDRRERRASRVADGRRAAAERRLAHEPRRLLGVVAKRDARVARAHERERHGEQEEPEERVPDERGAHTPTRRGKMLPGANRRLRQKPDRRKPAQPKDDRGQPRRAEERRKRERNGREQGQMNRQPILGKELLEHQPGPAAPDNESDQ